LKLECDSARGDFGSSDSPLSARRELGCGRGNTFGLRTGFAARFFIAKESRRANRNRKHSARRAADQRRVESKKRVRLQRFNFTRRCLVVTPGSSEIRFLIPSYDQGGRLWPWNNGLYDLCTAPLKDHRATVTCGPFHDGWIQAYSFSLRSAINGNLKDTRGGWGAGQTNCRGDVMRRILVALVAAATLAGASVAASRPALAWHGGGWRGGGWGWGAGGFVAGALVGSALAGPYGYGYYPYGYYPSLITAVLACGGAGGMATPGCAAAFKRYGWNLLAWESWWRPGGDARHAGYRRELHLTSAKIVEL